MARIIPIPIGPVYDGGPCRGIIHVVKAGDTLYQLGKQYHVSVGQLMFANPFVNVYNLQIGDELCIPVSIARESQNEARPWEAMPQTWEMEPQSREMTPQREEVMPRPWETDSRSEEMESQQREVEARPWEMMPRDMEEDGMEEG